MFIFSKFKKFHKLSRPILPALIVLLLLPAAAVAGSGDFTLATYNVENLFDAAKDGTEYPEYVPHGGYGWNRRMAAVKAENIAEVIAAMKADIICLQEIESRQALNLLLRKLKEKKTRYKYSAIADDRPTTVACALISLFPITEKKEIVPGKNLRSILKATINIRGHPLTVFVNHWKSKQGPESRRLICARALRNAIGNLDDHSDYVLAGDFNANYNEFQTFKNDPDLNDTGGLTGINHVLGTIRKGEMVAQEFLQKTEGNRYHYNLWLELPASQRWSHEFFGHRSSLDSILLPPGLFDDRGLSYVDDSFDKFDPGFLFHKHGVFRWQRENHGRGDHLGRGYADHLPLYARFTVGPFSPARNTPPAGQSSNDGPASARISDLYQMPAGRVNLRLENCRVIYKQKKNAVIKQKNGRAVYIYRAAGNLKPGCIYDLTARRLKDYYGLREITAVDKIRKKGCSAIPGELFLSPQNIDLNKKRFQNEVIAECTGFFKNSHLSYNGHRIRLYFKNKQVKPPEGTRVTVRRVRVGRHRTPELVIEKPDQITTHE